MPESRQIYKKKEKRSFPMSHVVIYLPQPQQTPDQIIDNHNQAEKLARPFSTRKVPTNALIIQMSYTDFGLVWQMTDCK